MPAGPATVVAVAVPVAASTCCAEWSHFDLELSYCCYCFVVTLSPHFVAMNYWDFVGTCSLQPADLLHWIATNSHWIAESSLVHFAVSNKRSTKYQFPAGASMIITSVCMVLKYEDLHAFY